LILRWVFISLFLLETVHAAEPTERANAHFQKSTSDQIGLIRRRVLDLEQEIVSGLRSAREAKTNVKKIQALLRLQQEERALGKKRLTELEATVSELESRKLGLDDKINEQKAMLRKSLIAVERSIHNTPVQMPEQEKLEAPRRRVLAALAQRGIAQIEELKIDLADAGRLEQTIAEEKQQLTYLFAELDEQEGILKFNQQLQEDMLRKHEGERLAQLDNYHKLKKAESQVEDLMQNFNARVELERAADSEKQAALAAKSWSGQLADAANSDPNGFARQKGLLKLPIPGGSILSSYGRSFDGKSGLYVFKKGIDIRSDKKQTVHAVWAGKIAYSGELPDYGRVAIVDHGGHFYSLCAHLGSALKKTGDSVAVGEAIGETDESGTPIYFEIRSRNVAVNPLQWISN